MKCEICELTCEIDGDTHGQCKMYAAIGGEIVPRYRNQLSSFAVGHIEDVPIFHFSPGSLTLLTGTISCNFNCSYCLNSHTLAGSGENIFRYEMTAEELVRKAMDAGCRNVAFNLNEPAVSFPYFLNVAAVARENGLKVGCATNGYFTVKAARQLADCADFVNISLKSIRNETYREICKVPSVEPVLRNIEVLCSKGVHVEVTTPVAPQIHIGEIDRIAAFLAGISRQIPWHLFRLLPEYRMAEEVSTRVQDLVAMRKAAMQHLDHVFIGNMVGSEWMDTICPNCGFVILKRINTLGCGARLVNYSLDQGRCPGCSNPIPIVGDCHLSPHGTVEIDQCNLSAIPESYRQSLGLLDTYGHQKTFDFRTGDTVATDSPMVAKVSKIISGRPYPGDELAESDTWVTDMALDLLEAYPADLVMLDYSQPFFIAANRPEGYRKSLENVVRNIGRFLSQTGYEPMVIGLGGMEPVEHEIDLESIFGTAESFAQSSGKYAYFSTSDKLRADPGGMQELMRFSRIVTRKEFLDSLEGGCSAEFAETLDDYIAIAHPGVMFKGLNSMGKKQYMTPSLPSTVPVYTTLEHPDTIAGITPVVNRALKMGQKVALIIMEGAGQVDLPWTSRVCRNGNGEYIYQLWQQYITIACAVPYEQSRIRFPFRKRYWLEESKLYPFSGKFNDPLENPLGRQIGEKKSLAVGNRNILTHVCLEADIVAECYCCYMHNYGVLTVFRDRALKATPALSDHHPITEGENMQ